jgi:hypothetical protein
MSLVVRDLRRSRKTYSYLRKEPVLATVSPGVGPTTVFAEELIDVSRYQRDYDIFENSIPFTLANATYIEYGTVFMSSATEKIHSFTNSFPGIPIVTIAANDYYGNGESNLATYILDVSSSSLTVGTSADFTGSIAYSAIWFNGTTHRVGYVGSTYYVIEMGTLVFTGQEEKTYVFTVPFSSTPSVKITPLETGSGEAGIVLEVVNSTPTGFTISTNCPLHGSVLFQAVLS